MEHAGGHVEVRHGPLTKGADGHDVLGRATDELGRVVGDAVSAIIGRGVGADEPLMSAGLDSLGSVELRSTLQVSFFVFLGGGSLLCPRALPLETQFFHQHLPKQQQQQQKQKP